jgi:hypothetical protein
MELHNSSEQEAPEKVTKLFSNNPLASHPGTGSLRASAELPQGRNCAGQYVHVNPDLFANKHGGRK